jgi:hypothetical protein
MIRGTMTLIAHFGDPIAPVTRDEAGNHAASARRKGAWLPDPDRDRHVLFEQIPLYLEFFGFGKVTPDELRAVAMLG